MLKINPNKEKKLTFDITVEGIDPSLLEYTLRITENGIDYGFKGKNENGEIVFTIPALNTILNKKRINEIKKVKLEVNDTNGKYYMKPYEDTVLIETEPELNVIIKKEENISEEKEIKVKLTNEIELTNNSSPDIVSNHTPIKTKIGKFLKG